VWIVKTGGDLPAALRPGAAAKLALAGAGDRRCRNGDVNRAAIASDYCE
jgi:hypothetical protein